MTNRSCVPKYIKREKMPTEDESLSNKTPMNFKRAEARKWRPAQNKGRGKQGGYGGH